MLTKGYVEKNMHLRFGYPTGFNAFFDDDDDGVEISAALGDWGSWDADSFDERVDERADRP